MMKFNQMVIMSVCALVLSACYVVPMENGSRVIQTSTQSTTHAPAADLMLSARLYPTNDVAQRAGAGNATVTITQSGHGSFKAYIGGESFTGDATRQLNSRSGKAHGAGASGRYIACDYTMNSDSVGTGNCRMSTGAQYSMHISR